ncbi:MAG: 23S rRNA (uridine(2552)-2'-O)-methyltransferase RlmE [Candidatus Altimarinota bacterium]
MIVLIRKKSKNFTLQIMTKPFIVQDPYFDKAKKLGYRARSAFKLIEIDEKFHVIKPGMCVLDVASAPGSFIQVISKIVGEEGRVIGVDIQSIKSFGQKNISFLQASIFEYDKIRTFIQERGIEQFDLITSDIAPNTSGITGVDQYRSIELNIAILDVAEVFLKKGGNLILKVFVGEDVEDLIAPVKQKYTKLTRFKPKACRDRSFEEYFICQGKK